MNVAKMVRHVSNPVLRREIVTHWRPRSHWFHDDPVEVVKVGRNDPCPCGSGRKYKHCCGRR